MSLVSELQAFAERIANEFRDGVNPRLLPPGGSANQILAKIDGADYNAEWVNGGGGSSNPYQDLPESSLNDFIVETSGIFNATPAKVVRISGTILEGTSPTIVIEVPFGNYKVYNNMEVVDSNDNLVLGTPIINIEFHNSTNVFPFSIEHSENHGYSEFVVGDGGVLPIFSTSPYAAYKFIYFDNRLAAAEYTYEITNDSVTLELNGYYDPQNTLAVEISGSSRFAFVKNYVRDASNAYVEVPVLFGNTTINVPPEESMIIAFDDSGNAVQIYPPLPKFYVSDTEPLNPKVGDIWIDTSGA